MTYYIEILMSVSPTEKKVIPAEFKNIEDRYKFYQDAIRAGYPVVEFGTINGENI